MVRSVNGLQGELAGFCIECADIDRNMHSVVK